MKWFVIAAAIAAAAPVAAAAQAGNAGSSNNLGQQNAVSNQNPTDPLDMSREPVGGSSQALSHAAFNATNNQQQSDVTMEASTTQGVSLGYGVNDGSTVGVSQLLDQSGAAQSPSDRHGDHK